MSSFISGSEVGQIIASKDIEVQDPSTDDTSFKRQIVAGQPVPPDLLEAYAKASGDKDAKDRVKAVRAPSIDKALVEPPVSK